MLWDVSTHTRILFLIDSAVKLAVLGYEFFATVETDEYVCTWNGATGRSVMAGLSACRRQPALPRCWMGNRGWRLSCVLVASNTAFACRGADHSGSPDAIEGGRRI